MESLSGTKKADYRDTIDHADIVMYQTVNQHYIFDVQKDEVKKISRDLFEYISDRQREISIPITEELKKLEIDGYLQPNTIEKIECYIGDYEKIMQKGIDVLTLQVTQMCNLKCDYCPHAQDGNHYMRTHANVKMSREMAFKAIDYLANNSKERKSIDISFFGGEPLIEFDLIRYIVLYAEEKLSDKMLTFNISTNAVFLTDEKIDFFTEHKFCICVSMDGPENIHNRNRRDWGGKGSFASVYENFRKLEKAVRNTQSKVIINAVLDKECNIDEVECFFNQLESDRITVVPSLVDDLSSTKRHVMTDEFYWKSTYLKFLLMLNLLKRIDKKDLPIVSRVFKSGLYEFEMIYDEFCKRGHTVYPILSYRVGDCEHSFRLYLNCQGNFYPTVGVNECENDMVIGNINEGISKSKMMNLLQTASAYKKDCRLCPAVSYCRLGVSCFVEEKGLTEHIRREYCESFLNLFHEAVGLYLLKEESKVYYQKSDYVCLSVEDSADVVQIVLQILSRIISKTVEYSEKNIEIPLVSREIGLSALELLYLLFELEKRYGITFEAADVRDYGFCSVQKIVDAILRKRSNEYECRGT